MSSQRPPHATVAVVVRTKNRPLLLARALESILAQTYEDWVAIVVNDVGDRAPVEAALARVADRAAGRIYVVHNTVSRGREAAMNTGVHESASTYIVIHDDDDSWAPIFLERTVSHLLESGGHAVAARAEVIYERIEGETVIEEGREILAADKHDISLLDSIERNYTTTNSFLYRRDSAHSVGDYDESLPVLADWDFLLRFLLKHDVGFIDGDPLAFWHRRPASVGDIGNSVHAAQSDHARWDTLIRDRYLRADLAQHDGLGYLLYLSEILDRDRKTAQDRFAHLLSLVDGLDERGRERDEVVLAKLDEVNRNLVSQNNRMVAQFERMGHRIEQLYHEVRSRAPGARLDRLRQAARHRLRRNSGSPP